MIVPIPGGGGRGGGPDPLAEVSRLRDPAGPWLHLLWGAPADARQFGWLLAQEGIASRVLRGPSVRTVYGLYDEAAAALQFPGDLVADWPAFTALLRDLSWLPGTGQVLVVTRASLLLAAAPAGELASFVSSVVAVATERAGQREAPLHVVLADDAVGLAIMRARLEAIPAGVRDVVGWLPEEPSVLLGASGRTTFVACDGAPDEVDQTVIAALSTRDSVTAVHRAGEEYAGPPSDPVRTYGVVLNRADHAVATAAELGRVLAAAGAAGVMLAIADDPASRGTREQSFLAAATQLWPRPAASPEPEPAAAAPIPQPTEAVAVDPAPAAAARQPAEGAFPAEPEIPAQPEIPAEPADDPAAAFTLVAADLEWEFARGSAEHDPVDQALVAAAARDGLFTAIFRTWSRDPGTGWVRVLVGYAVDDVDAARNALIGTAQSGGARRTCVEVVAEADVSDVHRWLERQCHQIYRAEAPAQPEPAPEPADYRPAPAEPDETGQHLVDWAKDRDGVSGIVAALAGETTVYGIVLAADADEDAIRTEAADLAGTAATVEILSPSRGLPPPLLKLYRGATRLWARTADRPTRSAVSPDYGPEIDMNFEPTVEIVTTEDEVIDDLTLYALSMTEPVSEEPPSEADDCDQAIVEWAKEHQNLLAVARGTVTARDQQLRVYLLATDDEADRPELRRAAAAIMAGKGFTAAGVEVFCPLDPIPRFYLDLYRNGRQLWRSTRKLTPRGETPPPAEASTE